MYNPVQRYTHHSHSERNPTDRNSVIYSKPPQRPGVQNQCKYERTDQSQVPTSLVESKLVQDHLPLHETGRTFQGWGVGGWLVWESICYLLVGDNDVQENYWGYCTPSLSIYREWVGEINASCGGLGEHYS